ncbi:MAG: hypothetical protein FWB96_01505 [Defluviitaleaceae bacterium]|nr:hypothetical protein [Defluviitaleaceae bacterium]MCL2261630.1 hypothetical protein [Defluviitaleaceae bacterium]
MDSVVFTKEDLLAIELSVATVAHMSLDLPITPQTSDELKSLDSVALNSYTGLLSYHQYYALTEKILSLSESKATDVIDLHFCYNHWIEFTYRARGAFPHYIDLCIAYCKKDMSMYEKFKKTTEHPNFQYPYGSNISFPSFQRLAIIHEKQGELMEAIEVCELAIKYNIDDTTKGGFTGRLEKLKKKMAQFH